MKAAKPIEGNFNASFKSGEHSYKFNIGNEEARELLFFNNKMYSGKASTISEFREIQNLYTSIEKQLDSMTLLTFFNPHNALDDNVIDYCVIAGEIYKTDELIDRHKLEYYKHITGDKEPIITMEYDQKVSYLFSDNTRIILRAEEMELVYKSLAKQFKNPDISISGDQISCQFWASAYKKAGEPITFSISEFNQQWLKKPSCIMRAINKHKKLHDSTKFSQEEDDRNNSGVNISYSKKIKKKKEAEKIKTNEKKILTKYDSEEEEASSPWLQAEYPEYTGADLRTAIEEKSDSESNDGNNDSKIKSLEAKENIIIENVANDFEGNSCGSDASSNNGDEVLHTYYGDDDSSSSEDDGGFIPKTPYNAIKTFGPKGPKGPKTPGEFSKGGEAIQKILDFGPPDNGPPLAGDTYDVIVL